MVLLVNAGAAEVRFRWAAVETDGVGYRLYWGPASGFYTNWETIAGIYATNCSVEVDGAQWFAATAFGPGGESDFSREVYWEPARPLMLIVEAARSASGATWQAVATNVVAADWPMEFFRVRIER